MAKYKKEDRSQKLLIAASLEEQLMPGSLEFAIHTLVETRMDTSIFDDRYHNDETGRPAYNPKMLLKVILFAYSRGLVHSRQIERACKENVTFMALSGMQFPDHSTIAGFVSSMKDEGLLGGGFLPWMVVSFLPMHQRSPVARFLILLGRRRRLRRK
jgi:hypothetical protein